MDQALGQSLSKGRKDQALGQSLSKGKMEEITETKQGTYRIINLKTCEVFCPLHEKNVCVYENCLDDCRFYEGLDFRGRRDIICTWPTEAS